MIVSPFLFLALLPPLTLPDLRIDGLTDDAYRVLPPELPAAARERADLRQGRVLDATTGRPVAGAQVETWTEEISRAGRGFRLVGEARSDAGGWFRVRVRHGGVLAEKLRVRAAGYLAFPGVVGDEETVYLMPRATTTRVRIVDLEGNPIPDARITSTYSCAHDVPAFDVRTGADGIAELTEYGLQDQPGELRVRAAGFGAIKYVDRDEVLPHARDAQSGQPAEIRLPRRRPMRARLVDRDGRALAGRALYVVDGDGYHVPFTDDEGRVAIASRYDAGRVSIYLLREGQNDFVFGGRLPDGREVTLNARPEDWPEDLPLCTLLLTEPPEVPERQRVPLHLFHTEGWTNLSLPRDAGQNELEFPPGRSLLAVGGDFSGWQEELVELDLEPGPPLALELAPRPEPTLTVLTPPGETHALVLQAGDASAEFEARDEGTTRLPIPPGRPVTVLARGSRHRLGTLPPLTADATLDLRPQRHLLPPDREQRLAELPRVAFRVEVRPTPAADEAPRAQLAADGPGQPEVERLGAAEFRVEAAAGAPVLLHASGAALSETWKQVFAPPGEPADDAPPVRLSPLRLGALEIRSELAFEAEGPRAESLDALHPGSCQLVLRLEDGRRVAFRVEIEPGRTRVLTLREEG